MNVKLMRRLYGHLKGYAKAEVDHMTARDFLRICAALSALEELIIRYEETPQEQVQSDTVEEAENNEEEIPEGKVVAQWHFSEKEDV